jgi:flagellar hook-associated protein 1 FlgK
MAGSFSSINTALSALRYQQVAMDVASTNIANSATDGYVRRRVVGETVGAGAVPAMWSRSDQVGNGVAATGVQRMVDALLDVRARREHGQQSYLDIQASVLARVETGFGEPAGEGVSKALTALRTSLADLTNAPGSDAARSQVLAAASGLTDALRLQSRQVADEAADQRSGLLSTVDEVNVVAAELASTNRSIAAVKDTGTDSSNLLDTRDRLALRLAELTGASTAIRSDGGADVTLNGVPLVVGQDASALRVSSGVTSSGAADGNPIAFTVDPAGTPVPAGLRGRAGGIAEVLDVTLPSYVAGLGVVAKDLADAMNAQHAAGYDLAGTAGGPLFGYDPADPAGSLKVLVTDPAKLAASALPGGVLDAGNADDLAAAISVDGAYQRLVTGFGNTVASVQRLSATQQALTSQVDRSREQLAGVNLDEETVNMISAQHAYEAAARVMTTLDSVLDTLINRTGLVR